MLDPVLETERLRLRLFEEADIDKLYQLYSDADVMRYLRGTRTRKDAEEHVFAFSNQFAKTGFTLWAVETKRNHVFVGRVGLWMLDDSPEVELGYAIKRSHWGFGIATEASFACLDHGFRRLHLECIAAIANEENTASRRVIAKLGFRFLREATFYDMDVLYHRLTRQEWLQQTE